MPWAPSPGAAGLWSLARSLDCRPTLRCLCRTIKRQTNHWPGSTNQAEACLITFRLGRPTARFEFSKVIFQVTRDFFIFWALGLTGKLSARNVVSCTELCMSLMGEGKCRQNTCTQTIIVIILPRRSEETKNQQWNNDFPKMSLKNIKTFRRGRNY